MTTRPADVPLRSNVCAVLTDEARRQVLVFRRVGAEVLGPHAWQFPQGGLKAGEDPTDGLRRELREEIGTDAVEILERLDEPIAYYYPPEVLESLRASDPAKAHYKGQAQHWFLTRLERGTEAIHFSHEPAEFDAFEWVTPAEALERVVPFKREAYRQGLSALGML